eukprot:6180873-Pleurochrysis_carterae.AAC.1
MLDQTPPVRLVKKSFFSSFSSSPFWHWTVDLLAKKVASSISTIFSSAPLCVSARLPAACMRRTGTTGACTRGCACAAARSGRCAQWPRSQSGGEERQRKRHSAETGTAEAGCSADGLPGSSSDGAAADGAAADGAEKCNHTRKKRTSLHDPLARALLECACACSETPAALTARLKSSEPTRGGKLRSEFAYSR